MRVIRIVFPLMRLHECLGRIWEKRCSILTSAKDGAPSAPGPGKEIGWQGFFRPSRCCSPWAVALGDEHAGGNMAFAPMNHCRTIGNRSKLRDLSQTA